MNWTEYFLILTRRLDMFSGHFRLKGRGGRIYVLAEEN